MAPRRAKAPKLPTFDPVPSTEFGLQILKDAKARHALIGKVAMWYWLDDMADHEYTKDVDFAVFQSSIPAILQRLHATEAKVSQLFIGGVNAQVPEKGIRADFIDRSNEEWGNLQPLYAEAIEAALSGEDRFQDVPVTPPEYLVAMKLGAGTDKDERDCIRLLAKVLDLDVELARNLTRKYVGPAGIGRLEECLRLAGHPKARRAYTAGS
jgi:hypothetical protein